MLKLPFSKFFETKITVTQEIDLANLYDDEMTYVVEFKSGGWGLFSYRNNDVAYADTLHDLVQTNLWGASDEDFIRNYVTMPSKGMLDNIRKVCDLAGYPVTTVYLLQP